MYADNSRVYRTYFEVPALAYIDRRVLLSGLRQIHSRIAGARWSSEEDVSVSGRHE